MDEYKINLKLFNEITEHIHKELQSRNIEVGIQFCFNGTGYFFYSELMMKDGIIIIPCRSGAEENYDLELISLIHEVGHCLQFKEKPELKQQTLPLTARDEEEAWDRGWYFMLELEGRIPLDCALFEAKFRENREYCLGTYMDKEKETITTIPSHHNELRRKDE